MRMLLSLAVALFSVNAFAGACDEISAQQAAILGLTQALEGNIFEAKSELRESNSRRVIVGVDFRKYHYDDDANETGLVPCGVGVGVNLTTCEAYTAPEDLDDNLMCWE